MEDLSRHEVETNPRIKEEDIKVGGIYRLLTTYQRNNAGDMLKITDIDTVIEGLDTIMTGVNILSHEKFHGYWFRLGPL